MRIESQISTITESTKRRKVLSGSIRISEKEEYFGPVLPSYK
jgi:hypothetical protein